MYFIKQDKNPWAIDVGPCLFVIPLTHDSSHVLSNGTYGEFCLTHVVESSMAYREFVQSIQLKAMWIMERLLGPCN